MLLSIIFFWYKSFINHIFTSIFDTISYFNNRLKELKKFRILLWGIIAIRIIYNLALTILFSVSFMTLLKVSWFEYVGGRGHFSFDIYFSEEA